MGGGINTLTRARGQTTFTYHPPTVFGKGIQQYVLEPTPMMITPSDDDPTA